jgi:hypothetical protein
VHAAINVIGYQKALSETRRAVDIGFTHTAGCTAPGGPPPSVTSTIAAANTQRQAAATQQTLSRVSTPAITCLVLAQGRQQLRLQTLRNTRYAVAIAQCL